MHGVCQEKLSHADGMKDSFGHYPPIYASARQPGIEPLACNDAAGSIHAPRGALLILKHSQWL